LGAGTACNAANTFATVRLSGDKSLLSGGKYQFAVRVTNPTASQYESTASGAAGSGLSGWTIRLQTRERDLIHETSQITGYIPAPKAIERFSVSADSPAANTATVVLVQFKLETMLLRWQTNKLELEAPSSFGFTCGQQSSRSSHVIPSEAILSGESERFQDLVNSLELPPAQGAEAYRNEGLSEDGRTIVDCSKPGRLSLAVDATDGASMGRYAFKVSVLNPQLTPVPNIWRLRSYSEGLIVEEGAIGGYTIKDAPSADTSNRQNGIGSGATLPRGSLCAVPVFLLIAVLTFS